MTPVDFARRQEAKLNHRNKEAYQYGATHQRAPDNTPD